jgi:arylsulfatase A-like enzyme
VREEGFATDLLGEDCVRLIKEHDFSKKPLFLYHPMFAVHGPNQAPPEYMAAFSEVRNPGRRKLMGLCAAMDAQFGRIIDAIREAGQLDNTLVFFHSDNGGNLHAAANNLPLRDGKGSYYDGGLRVPAFAYWPGKIQPVTSTDALAYAADIFPTLAALAGAPLPAKPLDGVDLAPVLFKNAAESGRREILFMLEDSERDRRGAAIEWPWKFLRTAKPGAPWSFELYDIAADPSEKTDLSKEHPDIVQRLSDRLDTLQKDAPAPFWKGTAGENKAPKGWKPAPVIGPDQQTPPQPPVR